MKSAVAPPRLANTDVDVDGDEDDDDLDSLDSSTAIELLTFETLSSDADDESSFDFFNSFEDESLVDFFSPNTESTQRRKSVLLRCVSWNRSQSE